MSESRVLVIEDDQVLRTVIADALLEDGYSVETASDGRVALKIAERSLPHLVIVDLMLPYLDGEEFSNAMRRIAGLESIPVVLVSASRRIEEVATRIGARAVLRKPFDLHDLTERVRLLLA
jgi:two-component system response regulator VicR